MSYNETIDRHLDIAQSVAIIDPNGNVSASKDYISLLRQTIRKHYPTSEEDIVIKLRAHYESKKDLNLREVYHTKFSLSTP